MKNLTEHSPAHSPAPPQKNLVLRGFGLAWLIVIAGYWAVTSIEPVRNLFWRGYFFLAPPVAATLVAVIFVVRGDKKVAGGILAGLISMLCAIIVLAILLIGSFFGDSPPLVNGWK